MLPKELKKNFEREFFYLQYYDKHKKFPFKKELITFTLSLEALEKLEGIKNKSKFVEDLILKGVKNGTQEMAH